MKFCILISNVLVFIFGLYAQCGDILRTGKVSEKALPSVFAQVVREGYELPLTIVSALLLSHIVGALARKDREFFAQFLKNTRWCPKFVWFGVLISGIVVLAGRFCERYGVLDHIYSIFVTFDIFNSSSKRLVLFWAYRSLCFLNGVFLLLIFIRSNRRLTVLLLVFYFVLGLLLMLGSPPRICLQNQIS